MRDLVIDASVVVEWYSPNRERPDLNSYALPLRQAALEEQVHLHVPHIFDVEISARLLRLYRRDMLGRGRLETAINELAMIPFKVYSFAGAAPPDYVAIGMRWNLAVYDAVYFALAQRLALPLATVDGGLLTAIASFGKAEGVEKWMAA